MEVLATSGMVLRDKNSSPKLIFDNSTHTRQGAEGPPEHLEVKKDLRGTKSVGVKGSTTRKAERHLSLSGEVLNMFRGDGRPASTKLSPEVDLEDHIIENIRNRGFWTRRSVARGSSLRASRDAALALPSSRAVTAPAHPSKGPFLFPEDPHAAAPEQGREAREVEGDAGEEEAAIDSAMMLEMQQEARLRDNITWMRQYLTQVSEADGGSFSRAAFLSALSNKELLCRVFSLWDVAGEGSLPQEEWIDFLKCSAEQFSSEKEVGPREWVELLEVLAYVVCGEEGEVTEEVFTTILTSRGVLEKLFHLINKDADGVVTRHEIMDFIANLTYARPRTGFTRENLEWLEQMFRQALGHKQELSFDDFKKIVHSRNSFFAERVFQIFDRDNSGTVSLSEFLDAMHQFAGKSPNDKIKFLFLVYDLDGDGLIQQSELQKVMKACMEENGMRFSDEQIQDLTLAMFEDADTQNTGAITYESLKAQLEKHDGLIENLSISIDRWLVPPNLRKEKDPVLKKVTKLRPYQMSLPYLKNNYVYLSFLLAYIAVNLGLFISRAIEYREHNGLTILARACGQCLNFNCMFVCVLVLRQSITYLRSMGGASFLPLDQHLYLHKLCGLLIFVYSVLHTIAHLINFGVFIQPLTGPGELNKNNCTYAELIFTMCPEAFGLIDGVANPTGVALMIILTVMVVCSLPFVRKSGYFEVFYWTHLLYIAFWTLCILHGPNFWIWFVAPGVIFVIERVHRSIRMRMGSGKTYISSGVLLPSKVIHLVIKRPPTFQFHPGDYVFINIPEIANYEWHPFTISSAPEQDDVLWLHIRAVGQWTRRLYDYFEREQQKYEQQQGQGGKPLHAAITLPDGSTALPTLIGEGRSGTYLSAATYATNTSHAPDSGGAAGKNGVANLAYEHDIKGGRGPGGEEGLPEGQEDVPVAATRRKRRQNKINSEAEVTKSQEDAERHPEASLSSLEGGEEAGQRQAWEGDSSALYRRPRLTHATSCKYMRRKPRVITLNLPSETESIDGDAEDSEETEKDSDGQDEGHDKDLRLTVQKDAVAAVRNRDLAVAEEGRARHKSQEERRKSRQEDRKRSRHEDRKTRKLSRLEEAMVEGGCAVGKPLVVYMDGPFGAPSSHIFRAQHAVLIATGIGVTPFASILQSIMHKYWKARHTCPRCAHTWTSDLPQSVMNLRKVDFFWINRDQRSFEWFVNLLSQLEIEQAEQGGVLERFLDMHMYITSALQKTDMKAVGLQLALDLLHEKEKRDLITGLKTRTNAGRPNWDKVFKQLANQQKGKITVFYCGPPALGRTLRYKCDEYGFDFRKEIF